MENLNKIINCKESELNNVVDEIISTISKENEIKEIGINKDNYHVGFIPFKSKITYSNNSSNYYSMDTKDYLYDFARFLRENKITQEMDIIYNLEYFINEYFGYPSNITREEILHEEALEKSRNEVDYKKEIRNNNISTLKNKGCAGSTEKSALAQNILSFLGFKTMYIVGCINHNQEEKLHAYNLINANDSYRLIDYSNPVKSIKNNKIKAFYPFIQVMKKEEAKSFLKDRKVKSFDDYYFLDNEKVNNGYRQYIYGKYNINSGNKSK